MKLILLVERGIDRRKKSLFLFFLNYQRYFEVSTKISGKYKDMIE
jgi:hypothetical protein